MRVDGALKSLFNGLSTMDERQTPPGFSKEELNFTVDPTRGLTRRAPTTAVTDVLDFDTETDAVRFIRLRSTPYAVIIRTGDNVFLNYISLVNLNTGETEAVSESATTYLQQANKPSDIVVAVVNNALFIANRQVVVEMTDEVEVEIKHSIINFREAMVGEQNLAASVTVGGLTYTATVNIPNGTTSVAVEIATSFKSAFDALAIPDLEVERTDNVLVFYRLTGAERIQGYVAASVSGIYNNEIIAINGTISDLGHRPARAPEGYIVGFQPEGEQEPLAYFKNVPRTIPGPPVVPSFTFDTGTKVQGYAGGWKIVQRIGDTTPIWPGTTYCVPPNYTTTLRGICREQTFASGWFDNNGFGGTVYPGPQGHFGEFIGGADPSTDGYSFCFTTEEEIQRVYRGGSFIANRRNIINFKKLTIGRHNVVTGLDPTEITRVAIRRRSDNALVFDGRKDDLKWNVETPIPSFIQSNAEFDLRWNVVTRGTPYAGQWLDIPLSYRDETGAEYTFDTFDFVDGETYDVYLSSAALDKGDGEQGKSTELADWVPVAKPGEPIAYRNQTMPHALLYQETSDPDAPNWQFGTVTTWDKRVHTVGDRAKRLPGFVGNTINDLAIFQNRLCILSGDRFITSETNDPLNFWPTDIDSTPVTDPIEIGSAAGEGSVMDFFVEHDRDLLLFSNAGQFKIDGDTALTPQTASMVRTTEFEYTTEARPVGAGSNVFYTFTYGDTTGIARYHVENQRDSIDTSIPITDHVELLIPNGVKFLEADGQLGMVFVGTGDNVLYVGQSVGDTYSWRKWEFGSDRLIGNISVVDGDLVLVSETGDSTDIELPLVEGDIEPEVVNVPRGIVSSMAIRRDNTITYFLDEQEELTVSTGGQVTTTKPLDTNNIDEYELIYLNGDYAGDNPTVLTYDKVDDLHRWTLDTDELDFTDEDNPIRVIMGRKVNAKYTPIRLRLRDEGGHLQETRDARLSVFAYSVGLYQTPQLDATILDAYTSPLTQEWNALTVGDLNAITDGYDTGEADKFFIGCRRDARTHNLQLSTNGPYNVTIAYIEWQGNYSNRGRRF